MLFHDDRPAPRSEGTVAIVITTLVGSSDPPSNLPDPLCHMTTRVKERELFGEYGI
jgi:hypothetical protein